MTRKIWTLAPIMTRKIWTLAPKIQLLTKANQAACIASIV